ncbi:cytochrome B, partial [Vibrio vulnificus]
MTDTLKWDWVERVTYLMVVMLFFAKFFVLEEGREWQRRVG